MKLQTAFRNSSKVCQHAFFLFFCCFSQVSSAQDGTSKKSSPDELAGKSHTQVMMQNKLLQMNELFAAIINGDLDKAQKTTKILGTLSKSAEMFKQKDKDFVSIAHSFQLSADNMVQQIESRNNDGIMLGYIRLTMACSHCHTTVRNPAQK